MIWNPSGSLPSTKLNSSTWLNYSQDGSRINICTAPITTSTNAGHMLPSGPSSTRPFCLERPSSPAPPGKTVLFFQYPFCESSDPSAALSAGFLWFCGHTSSIEFITVPASNSCACLYQQTAFFLRAGRLHPCSTAPYLHANSVRRVPGMSRALKKCWLNEWRILLYIFS